MTSRSVSMLVIGLLTFAALGAGASAQDKKETGKPAKTKVAFALLSTIHDLGWTTAHYRGIEYLKKEMKEGERRLYRKCLGCRHGTGGAKVREKRI